MEIPTIPGIPLMGYGARNGAATGVHDPIRARGLALGPEEAAVVIVSVELCLMLPVQAQALRERIADATGVAPDRVLISCTHTHSAPDTGAAAAGRGEEPPGWVEGLFDGIVEAGVAAHRARRPARAGWGNARVVIGRNRRIEQGPLDPDLLLLRIDGMDGAPIAVLYHYACHGTVLGHENLEISADWSGVTSAALESVHGGVAPFLLGAHADIDPRTRSVMDLAIPGQSLGLGFEAVRVLGSEVAEAALAALPAVETTPSAPVSTSSTATRLALHGGPSESEAARRLEQQKRDLAAELGLEPEAFPRLSEIYDHIYPLVEHRPVSEARELIARARLYLRDKTGPFFVGGEREVDVETQVLRIGDAALLALPIEPTTNVGLDWKARARKRGLRGGVCGIANGWLRYLPHRDDLAEPRAHQHYEVLMSLFEDGASEALLAGAEASLDRLLSP